VKLFKFIKIILSEFFAAKLSPFERKQNYWHEILIFTDFLAAFVKFSCKKFIQKITFTLSWLSDVKNIIRKKNA